MKMNVRSAAVSLAATALIAMLTACGREQTSEAPSDSTEPKLTQPAPDDSTYTGAAGRQEAGPAADQSASGESEQNPPSAPPQ
jgi:hypothetical protein